MKTKKVINPNLMFTVFSAFGEKSPGQVRKHMIEWIESNLETFKSQVFMAMAVCDIYFDSWIIQIKSNEFIGDEFCLSALYQMCQRHALVVTSEKVWTTILPSFQKTDDEICRLCDTYLPFVCRDTYAMLKPVFEWKREVPSGEVSLVTPSMSEPLGETTDTQVAKDQNDQSILEVKQEMDNPLVNEASNVQDELGLVNVPALPGADQILLDATTNLLVDLTVVNETPMNVTGGIPTVDEEGQPMDTTIEISANVDELIQGPRTMTRALKIEKANQFSSIDSEATMNNDPDSAKPSRK